MTPMEALQWQHVVLLFTLGGLIGTPVGWWLGWISEPDRLWISVLRIVTDVFRLDRDMSLMTAYVLSIQLEADALKGTRTA